MWQGGKKESLNQTKKVWWGGHGKVFLFDESGP